MPMHPPKQNPFAPSYFCCCQFTQQPLLPHALRQQTAIKPFMHKCMFCSTCCYIQNMYLIRITLPANSTGLMLQGDPGDLFYIIKEGEAVVYQATPQGTRKVNHLFKADFFGERALLCDEPRSAAHALLTLLHESLHQVQTATTMGMNCLLSGEAAGVARLYRFHRKFEFNAHSPFFLATRCHQRTYSGTVDFTLHAGPHAQQCTFRPCHYVVCNAACWDL